jgi:hypothetical protein
VHLCASHRLLRAQRFDNPEFRAHFRLFVTLSAGRGKALRTFEENALSDALGAQLGLLAALRASGWAVAAVAVSISADAAHENAAERACRFLSGVWTDVAYTLDPARIAASGYYRGACFTVTVTHADGRAFPLGDGGFTDWVARLTASRKERTCIGAIATELLARLFAPEELRVRAIMPSRG